MFGHDLGLWTHIPFLCDLSAFIGCTLCILRRCVEKRHRMPFALGTMNMNITVSRLSQMCKVQVRLRTPTASRKILQRYMVLQTLPCHSHSQDHYAYRNHNTTTPTPHPMPKSMPIHPSPLTCRSPYPSTPDTLQQVTLASSLLDVVMGALVWLRLLGRAHKLYLSRLDCNRRPYLLLNRSRTSRSSAAPPGVLCSCWIAALANGSRSSRSSA
jgi:hypothetical protein